MSAEGGPVHRTLDPVRHACHACGACCTGWFVGLLADERLRIARHADALGVTDPIVDGALRQVDRRCVFLDEDRRCRIHARFGAAEKPLVCRTYPRLRMTVEDGVRAGADPSCSSTWRSYRDGPPLDVTVATLTSDEERPTSSAAREEELIALLRTPGMTIAELVGRVTGDERSLPDLPLAFAKHTLTRMKAASSILSHPSAGPIVLADLAQTRDFLRAADPTRPPLLTVGDEISAFTFEVARRTLFLRLGEYDLTPDALLALVIAGAITCAWAEPRIERFGPALSAWSRVTRIGGAWRYLFPDAAAYRGFGVPLG